MYYDDCPWWYNERASLSIFAGAVWRAGGWAFEEFSARKHLVPEAGKRASGMGRCDINFGFDTHEFVGEAKQCWPILTPSGAAGLEVVRSLAAAEHDARRLTEMDIPCLGMVFVAPRIHMDNRAFLRRELAAFTKAVSAIAGATIAWTFPSAAHDLRPANRNKRYMYPGIVLIMRRAA